MFACKTGEEFVKTVMGGWNKLALYPEPKKYLLGESTKAFEPAEQTKGWANFAYPAREFEVTGNLVYLMHSLMAGSLIIGDKKKFPKLSDENFAEFQQWLLNAFGTEEARHKQVTDTIHPIARGDVDPAKFDAFMALTVTHDLGKAKKFLEDVERYGGTVAASHDETIALAVEDSKVSGLLTSIERLDELEKQDVKAVFKANCNLGRVMQLECKAGELEGLKNLTEQQANMLVAHIATDVAGALGHVNPSQSILWSNQMHEGYKPVFEIVPKVANGEMTPQEAFEQVLRHNCKLQQMDYDVPEERAAVILSAQTRGKIPAQEICDILQDREENNPADKWKERLISEECETGYDKRAAICLGFAPDVFGNMSQGLGSPEAALEPWLQWKSEGYKKVREATVKLRPELLGLNKEGHGQIIVEYDTALADAKENPRAFIRDSHNLTLKGTTISATMPDPDVGIKIG